MRNSCLCAVIPFDKLSPPSQGHDRFPLPSNKGGAVGADLRVRPPFLWADPHWYVNSLPPKSVNEWAARTTTSNVNNGGSIDPLNQRDIFRRMDMNFR